jgi:hypothetical protein
MTPAKRLFKTDGSFDWETYFKEQSESLLDSVNWYNSHVVRLTAENELLRAQINNLYRALKKDNL